MNFNSKIIQKQYEGFLKTKQLWHGSFSGLQQLKVPNAKEHVFKGELTKNNRLGKRVESFVFCYLQQFNNIEITHHNIQVKEIKNTIGEIDCILLQGDSNIHLEVSFKYYLYDKAMGNTEVEQWIGPNRNDSLIQKIEKLKTKQLPLLYKKETKKHLDIEINSIKQKVFFKAQLFVPYYNQNIKLEKLNADCISGFYIYQHELSNLSSSKFHIPTKMNWLLEPHKNVDWLLFKDFIVASEKFLSQKKSPLCWIKQPNGVIFKFFLVWW